MTPTEQAKAVQAAREILSATKNVEPDEFLDALQMTMSDGLWIEVPRVAAALIEATERAEVAEGRARVLEAALDLVMLGGNHLAIHLDDPLPPDTGPHEALEIMGASVEFDIWCCWAAIMKARVALASEPEGK